MLNMTENITVYILENLQKLLPMGVLYKELDIHCL
jgi:hypothetical protein